MSFSAVITSHANPLGLAHTIGMLTYQSVLPTEIIVLASDTHLWNLQEDFPEVRLWIPCENKEDWGHEKRALGLTHAEGEFCGFFNDDDEYHDEYLEHMLNAVEGKDVAYCNWTEHNDALRNCDFQMADSTAGNFVFRTSLGRKVGYTDRVYEADGHFINKLRDATTPDRIAKIDKVLYYHNKGVRSDG